MFEIGRGNVTVGLLRFKAQWLPPVTRLGNFTRVVEGGFVCSGLLIIVFVRRFDSELACRGGCIGWGRALLLLLQDLILPHGLASGIAVWVIWISAPFSFLAREK